MIVSASNIYAINRTSAPDISCGFEFLLGWGFFVLFSFSLFFLKACLEFSLFSSNCSDFNCCEVQCPLFFLSKDEWITDAFLFFYIYWSRLAPLSQCVKHCSGVCVADIYCKYNCMDFNAV